MSSAITSVVVAAGSAYLSYDAAENAADAQNQAADNALNSELKMFYESRKDTAPWREAGEWALGSKAGVYIDENYYGKTLSDEQLREYAREKLNIGPLASQMKFYSKQIDKEVDRLKGLVTTQGEATGLYDLIGNAPTEEDFQKSSSYNWLKDQGLDALQKSASARGRLDSGGTTKDILNYAEGLAGQQYTNYLNNWLNSQVNPRMSMAGMGQVSAGQSANNAIATGQSIANTQLAAGEARASGYINQANAITGGANSAMNNVLFYNALKK